MEIVIIGLGSISKKHILSLDALGIIYKIKALRSNRNATVEKNITNIYDLSEIGHPDFVIISNPTSEHFQTIKSIAEIGLPMFIEKPAVHSLDNITEILALIRQNNLFTYVGCNLRFHPCLKYVKEQLFKTDKVINEVNIYCGSYLPDWRPGQNYKNIYSANLEMGGGVHLDLFHEMDYACWLFGQPNTFKGFSSSKSSLGINAPDYSNYILSYPSFNISIILNYYRREAKRSLEIVFEENTWYIDLIRHVIYDGEGALIFEAPNFNILDSYKDQMKYFIECLNTQKVPMNTFSESIEILKISLSNEPIR